MSESPVLIPHPYQKELHSQADVENLIICMEPGKGKTLIAAMLISSMLDRHLFGESADLQRIDVIQDEKPLLPTDMNRKKAIFLVNNVVLVEQQGRVLAANCAPYIVGKYHGQMGVEFWNMERWQLEYAQHDIMVMTAQVFLDNLAPVYITMNDTAVLIFDECHHARKKHPFNRIMQEFYFKTPIDDRPRILGLTASSIATGTKKCQTKDQVNKQLLAIATNLDSKLLDADAAYPDVRAHNNSVLEEELYFGKESAETIYSHLLRVTPAKELGAKFFSVDSVRYVVKALGAWCGYLLVSQLLDTMKRPSSNPYHVYRRNVEVAMTPEASVVEASAATASTPRTSALSTQVSAATVSSPSESADIQWLLELKKHLTHVLAAGSEDGTIPAFPTSKNHMTEQVQMLIAVLLKHFRDAEGSSSKTSSKNGQSGGFCCIVNVQRRYTASILAALINAIFSGRSSLDYDIPHLRAAAFTGDSSSITRINNFNGVDSNTRTLDDFRAGRVNILVATAIAEEGLDVQTCNLVIRFNPNLTVASYIQSRGRARCRDHSKYILMINPYDSDVDEVEKLERMRRAERWMKDGEQEIASGMYSEDLDSQKTIMSKQRQHETDIGSYEVASTGAVVYRASAVSLLHKYCDLLPYDKYCRRLGPCFDPIECGEFRFRYSLTLPPHADVTDTIVTEQGATSKKCAKETIALKMCKLLHEAGGLDDNLLPSAPLLLLRNKSSSATDQQFDPVACENSLLAYEHVLLGKDESLCRQQMKNKFATAYDPIRLLTPAVILPNPHEKGPQVPLEGNRGDLSQSYQTLLLHCYTIDNSILNNIALEQSTGCRFGLLSAVDLQLPVGSVAADATSTGSSTLLGAPLQYSYGSEEHNLKLRCAGKSCFDRLRFQQLQRYFSALIALVVTSKHMNNLLNADTQNTSAPLIIVPLLPFHTPLSSSNSRSNGTGTASNDWELIDWSEVARVVDAAAMMGSLDSTVGAILDSMGEATDADASIAINERFAGQVLIANDCAFSHQLHVLHVLSGVSANDVILSSTKSTPLQPATSTESTSTFDSARAKRKRDIENELADSSGDVPATQNSTLLGELMMMQSQRYNERWESERRPLVFADRSPSAREIAANFLDTSPVSLHIPTLEQLPQHDDQLREGGLQQYVYRYRNRPQLRYVNYIDAIRNYRVYPLNVVVARCACALPLLLNRVQRRMELLQFQQQQLPDLAVGTADNSTESCLEALESALTASSSRLTYSYERLEFLGDAALKLLCSVHLYAKYPQAHEGKLTSTRSVYVSNSNLMHCGLQNLSVPRYLQVREILLPQYFPQGFNGVDSVEGRISANEVPDKMVADAVEAIIGAFYLRADGALDTIWSSLVLPLNIIQDPEAVPLPALLATALDQSVTRTCAIELTSNAELLEVQQKVLGYKFKYPSLLEAALTHASCWTGGSHYSSNQQQQQQQRPSMSGVSYQRLEFLGDAALGLVVTEFLYQCKAPTLDPGAMTSWRSLIAGNRLLSFAVARSGIHRYIRHDSEPLRMEMNQFVEFAKSCSLNDVLSLEETGTEQESLLTPMKQMCNVSNISSNIRNNRGTGEAGGNSSGYGKTIATATTTSGRQVPVPKVLADVLEALIGAVYLDSGGDMQLCTQLVHRLLLEPFIYAPLKQQGTSAWGIHCHPTTAVLEILAKVGCSDHHGCYEATATNATTAVYVYWIHGVEVARASSKSKKIARRVAMKELLGGDPVAFMSKCRSQCNCGSGSAEEKMLPPPAESSSSSTKML